MKASLNTPPFFYHFAALRFIRQNRRLAKYIIYPFLINFLVFSILLIVGVLFYQDWLQNWISPTETWYMAVLFGLVLGLTILISLIIIFFIFSAVGSVIAAPFNDELSRHVEEISYNISLEEPFEWDIMVKDIGRTITEQIQRLFFLGMVWIAALPIWFIPVVGQLTFMGITLTFLGWEYLDISLSRHKLGFHQKRRLLMQHLGPMFIYGGICALFLMIPLVNFFSIPLSVVGGTLFYCERLRPDVLAIKAARDKSEKSSNVQSNENHQ